MRLALFETDDVLHQDFQLVIDALLIGKGVFPGL